MSTSTETPHSQKLALAKVARLTKAAEKAAAEREAAIVAAYFKSGVGPTAIAEAAGVTKGRIHQIVAPYK